MARAWFGGGVADFVVTAPAAGDPLRFASVTLTMWDAETGGTQVTDLVLAGAPVGSIPVGVGGQIPTFEGPDGVYALWAQGETGGTRSRLDAVGSIVEAAAGVTDGLMTAVASNPASDFAVQQSASFVQERAQRWDLEKEGVPVDGTTVADTAFGDLLAAMNPGDELFIRPGSSVKLANRHDINKKIVIEGGDATIVQASTAGALRFVAGSDGSRVRNLKGVGPSGTTFADDSVLLAVVGTVGAYLNDIEIENVRGDNWGYGTIHAEFVRNIRTRNVHTEDCMYAGQMFESCEDITLWNPTCDNLQGLAGNSNSYPVAFTRDSSKTIALAPLSVGATVHGGWARNTTWESLDAHGGRRIKVFGYDSYNTVMGICFTRANDHLGVPMWGSTDCWAFGCTADSGVSDGSARDGFMLIGAAGQEKATGGFIGCTSIGHGDQDLAGDLSGAFNLQQVDGAQILGGRAIEGSPHGVVLTAGVIMALIDGLDIIDPWSNSTGAVAGIRFGDLGQSIRLANTRLRAGTKTATYLRSCGIRLGGSGTDTTSRIYDGGGNDFSGASAVFNGSDAMNAVRRSSGFGLTSVAKPTALTAANSGTINTGDATSDTIIANMRTRIEELETKLKSLDFLT